MMVGGGLQEGEGGPEMEKKWTCVIVLSVLVLEVHDIVKVGYFYMLFMPPGRQVKGGQQWNHDNQLGRGWLKQLLTQPFQAVWNPTWDSEGTEEHFNKMALPHWFPLTGIRAVLPAPKMVHRRRRATRAMKYLVSISFRALCSSMGIHCSSVISLWLWLC